MVIKTIREPQTGSEYNWLFAAGCFLHPESRKIISRRITREEYRILRDALQTRTYPPTNLIRKAFTGPYEKLKEYGLPCTVAGMKTLWCERHNTHSTPVHIVTINTSTLNVCVVPEAETKSGHIMYVLNVHGYDIKKHPNVYVHCSTIADVVR
jgi:hypothetical protein